MRHSQRERREKVEVLLVNYSFWSKMCFRFRGYRLFLLRHNSKFGGGPGGACDKLVPTFNLSNFSLAECSSNIKKVLLYFHFWDLFSSFDPELCICIYVAYQPAFGWPPLPIFNL